LSSGFATNGYGEHSPGHYSMLAAFVCEVVMTFFFLMVILGSTDARAVPGFAPLAIGLCLTLIHLISIPVTNTSVNPARSTAPALFVGGAALSQLWLFWMAPFVGAAIAGVLYPRLFPAATPAIAPGPVAVRRAPRHRISPTVAARRRHSWTQAAVGLRVPKTR